MTSDDAIMVSQQWFYLNEGEQRVQTHTQTRGFLVCLNTYKIYINILLKIVISIVNEIHLVDLEQIKQKPNIFGLSILSHVIGILY